MEELKEKLRQAQQDFNYADENYIDIAVMELTAVEERLNLFIKEMKENECKANNKETKGIKATLSRICD